MGNRKNSIVLRKPARESFLLIKPNSMNNADEVAREIAAYEGVNKVFMTSGEYGFIAEVKGNCSENQQIENVVKRLSKGAQTHYSDGHFVYKSRAYALQK
ncbi:MAG: hypothetical protein ACP5MK_01190 [Candidatus Micrarchaeia archaeon]